MKSLMLLAICSLSFSVFSAEFTEEEKNQISAVRAAVIGNRDKLAEINISVQAHMSNYSRWRAKYLGEENCKIINLVYLSKHQEFMQALNQARPVIVNLAASNNNVVALKNNFAALLNNAHTAVANCNDVPVSAGAFKNSLTLSDAVAAFALKALEGETPVPPAVADDFHRIEPKVTKIVFLKAFNVPSSKNTILISKENGKKCEFYLFGKPGYSIPAGTEFFIEFRNDEDPRYGLYIVWNYELNKMPSALACENGLNVDQIHDMIKAIGVEFKDLK